ncbi:MAG: hypothetical protein ACXAB4_07960 [Candidatus Hodarchaeales archaeon]
MEQIQPVQLMRGPATTLSGPPRIDDVICREILPLAATEQSPTEQDQKP